MTDLREMLKDVDDASRISQKFLLGKGTIDDLVSMRDTIEAWNTIRKLLVSEKEIEQLEGTKRIPEAWRCLEQLMEKMSNLHGISERISMAVECDERPQNSSTVDGDGETDDPPISDAQQADSDATKTTTFFGLEPKWSIKPQWVAVCSY